MIEAEREGTSNKKRRKLTAQIKEISKIRDKLAPNGIVEIGSPPVTNLKVEEAEEVPQVSLAESFKACMDNDALEYVENVTKINLHSHRDLVSGKYC